MVKTEQGFGIGTRALILPFGEKLRDGQKAIGDALHRGEENDNVRAASDRLHQSRGVQHALSTEQRGAAELEGDESLGDCEAVRVTHERNSHRLIARAVPRLVA